MKFDITFPPSKCYYKLHLFEMIATIFHILGHYFIILMSITFS